MDEVQSSAEFYSIASNGRTNVHPEHWPAGVNTISLEGLSYLGMDTGGHLYLDGKRLYTAQRFSWFERIAAGLLTAAALVGSLAAVAGAWAQWQGTFHPSTTPSAQFSAALAAKSPAPIPPHP